jgi:hypothetical protein
LVSSYYTFNWTISNLFNNLKRMPDFLINLLFRVSGYTFNLKQKIVKADNWLIIIPYTFLLIISELGFIIVSLPVYILVPPKKVQEEGFIFPKEIKDAPDLKVYTIRRKITLTTILGTGGVLFIKVALIGLSSFFLFGGLQQLLADTQDWTFSVPGDYTYDNTKIDITGGVAQLKDLGGLVSGATTNSGFTTALTPWTYVDWLMGSKAVGAQTSSGGNPGGYGQITLNPAKNSTVAGYFMQSFTTTVNSPDTATLNLDWSSISVSVPATPSTYRLYAFIETTNANPTATSTAVWSSPEITASTAWASSTTINITGKVPTAGTYYLKIAAYMITPGTTGTYTVVSGFDNVIVNWSKVTHSYATVATTTPVIPLSVSKAISWNAFNETATKNGGEIYYQLSSDNGTNWKYYNGSVWATSTLATDYSTASVINTNINKFATSTNQIKWRAYLTSNGTQQVILDNVGITYTQNQLPSVQNLTPTQNTNYGYIHADYNLQDTESDPSSLTAYEYSTDNISWFTMTASTTDPTHSGVTGLTTAPSGIAHTFVWDAKSQLGNIYDADVYVRLRPNDGIGNGVTATSSAFAIDYATSTVSNVVAVQNLGTTTVSITYDLFDNTADNILVEAQISGDGGASWTVATSTLTGAIGSGVTSGNGKTITWNALADYPNQQKNNLQIRIRAKDKFQNQGSYTNSANFSLDTLAPTTLIGSNLLAQPNAGDTTVLIGGTFTESNPNTNDFYVTIDNGAYGSATAGNTNTAAPANVNTNVGSTLDGNDYISKVKIVHTDDYGLTFANENTTPTIAYKYVKPYTPAAPTLNNPVTNRLDLTINPNVNEANDLEYTILETSQNKYVQSDGTLGTNPVWQVIGTGAGQWGNGLGVAGKIRVTGLTSPVSLYSFKVKSRNPNDTAHAATSESAYSATASIPNTAPVIALNSYTQTTDGTQYTNINYTGTDGQGDINNITTYEYSTDNSTWHVMTEKVGAGSNSTSSLVFLPTGSDYKFVWDSAANLPNIEDSTVYARLRANDTQANSNLAVSSAFEIDNKLPVITGITASQNPGAKTVAITYNLADANNSLVQIDISSDGGSTWTVATSSLTGAVGSGITPGSKTATWNAGVNFNDQYNTQMKVRVRARDTYGNQGDYVVGTNNFTVDTHAPILSSVTAIQDSAAKTFTFHYDVSEDIGNANVVLEVSSNSGSTWVVPITTATGDIGSTTPGTNKTITWNAGVDYNNQEKTGMKIRLTATDSFTNSSNLSSADFTLDSLAPRITNVTAAQTLASTSVIFHYDLADQNTSNIAIDISSDSGSTWTVTDTTINGDNGAGITSGTNKTITWNATADFPNQDISTMKVRVRGTDIYNNASNNATSSNFLVDTLAPAVNVTANLLAQPNAGDTTALIGGSFTETHPDTNNFYVALNNGAYGASTNGTTNTASPANQLTATGATLDGNDYISQVKITHTDDYGQSTSNENNSPATTYKYVKPYTPPAPTVDNPGIGTVDVLILKHANETDGLEYAIFETSQNKYVQSDGTLGTNPVWQTLGTGAGEWGNNSGLSGKINVSGLATHSYLYQFQVKSRNTSDSGHAASSESALSSGASSANQSPVITIDYLGQSINGSKYVTINYTGSDLESEIVSLTTYQYSTDNSTWHTMTEKSGVGSDGLSGLAFTYPGTAHDFMWDVAADLNNTEDNTVYVRLRANDGTSNGGTTVSSAFTVDTKNPVISAVTGNQLSNSNNVTINYNLTDLTNSTVELQISNDAGVTWNTATTTATGDLGININPNNGKTINWNPGVDYSGQEDNDLRVQLKATDNYGNAGIFASSANFTVDTKSPVITNITASQNAGNNTVNITYDISDANNAAVELDISSDGGATWNVTDTSVTGAVNSSLAPGTNKTITWNAGADFPGWEIANMKVRLRATDTHNNATGNIESANFSLDTKAPVISNVTAAQILATDTANFTYTLTDSGNAQIIIDISSDSGSTWTVATTTLTGDIGTGINAGNKTVTWNAAVNYNNHQNDVMKIRVRGIDTFNNISANFELPGLFSIDTLAPTINTTADLTTQANAGDTLVSLNGSFTESNPNTNEFLVAINGGAYGATTTGEVNTANPANQNVAVGATLTGNDYISKVKLIHTDDYNHLRVNENTTPNVAYKYVKPYTPTAPTVNNPQNTSVDLTINTHAGESNAVEYAIYESNTNKYVQANGELGTNPVWKTRGTGVGQWGNLSGETGKITINGLNSPVANYSFMVKARNPQDSLHAASSESAYSAMASITNTAPNINITSVNQSLTASYVEINYTGTDTQNDTNNLTAYEYSINGLNWQAMTEKSGVGSNGVNGLIFSSTSTNYTFAWDVATDLPNQEQATVYIRLMSTDTLTNSNLAVSSAFYTDTRGPVITNLSAYQAPNSNLITFGYDLSDSGGSNNTITLEISNDGGTTYNIATTTLTGDIGSGVTSGSSRSVTWNAGTDFLNQESNTMKIKIRGTDRYNNTGSYAISNNFTVDAKTPVISGITASQINGSGNVTINYNLTDSTPAGHLVEFSISNDSGSTWTVATTTFSGEIGSGQTTGTKSFIWSANTDYSGYDSNTMKVRIRAKDYFNNQGAYASSSDFSLDTLAPAITNINATQTASTTSVAIHYDLNEAATTTLSISSDGGTTWTVATTTLTGNLGLVSAGLNKLINWNAVTDFGNQENANMRVRLNGVDNYGNTSIYYESSNFSVDTAAPLGLLSLNKFSSTPASVSLSWQANTDAHFDHYELWHGYNLGDVNNRTGSASKWSVTNDANLNNPLTISTAITGIILNTNYYVRIWAIDIYGNKITVPAIDVYDAPIITNITASQALDSDIINIGYDLADSSNVEVIIDISADGGTTWNIATSSLAGDAGLNITPGNNKTATWDAAANYNNHQSSNMKVRLHGIDTTNNISSYVELPGLFSVDTLAPVNNITADLQAQPNAGDVSVLIGGSFTEVNPNTNNFYVAINNGTYSSSTSGNSNTATPTNQNTSLATLLVGHDYISQVKITHTDDYGHSVNNENNAPNIIYKYVKPYTPLNPTVNNPQTNSVDVTINHHVNEASDVEYAIYESSTGKYVQTNGSLGTSPVWQIIGTGTGEWGNLSGTSGKITITGLTSPVNNYNFAIKSRNPSDAAHAATSESNLSGSASSANQSPVITINSVSQTTNGSKYVIINYEGSDLESNNVDLITYEYSTNTIAWTPMTEKSGVGSDGLSGLAFTYPGTAHDFMWDVAADLNNTEDNTVYVRLRANDGTSNGGTTVSSAFTVDTKNPVISAVTGNQLSNSNNSNINYTLNDLSNSTINLEISSDGGTTWTVATTTATGDLGINITPNNNKTIAWNPGVDYSGQENNDLRARLMAIDNFGNVGIFTSSSNFSIDTKSPVFNNITANQNTNTETVAITYDISDANNSTVTLGISSDGGTTWAVANTSVSGAIGNNINPGTNKTITWNAGIDFPGQAITNMKVRLRATDTYNNITGYIESNEFTLNTQNQTPTVNLAAATGGAPIAVSNIEPLQPILNLLVTPTRNSTVRISGLAEPRSRVELYDNNVLIGSFNSLADNNGLFSQDFKLTAILHTLTVRSFNSSNIASPFSNAVVINIITAEPMTPIILSPKNNATISDQTPQIIGVADPNNQIIIKVDDNEFIINSDNDGAWSFILPNTFALTDGEHTISVMARDNTNTFSGVATATIIKLATLTPIITVPPITTPPVIPTPTPISGPSIIPNPKITSLPSAALINEATGATELPGIPVPRVMASQSTVTTVGDVISFTGTSLPNFDIVAYIHSNQALIYQTRTDENGNWRINHSQTSSELAPGEHTIYAVALDTNAKVKSRPSAVSSFTVQRSFWIMIFNYLNWPTTAATLIILVLTAWWLYHIRSKRKA